MSGIETPAVATLETPVDLAAASLATARAVRECQRKLGSAPGEVRDRILERLAALLDERREELMAANRRDLEAEPRIPLPAAEASRGRGPRGGSSATWSGSAAAGLPDLEARAPRHGRHAAPAR